MAKDASARGKLAKRKGKIFERAVAAQYREIFGERVKRGWQAREGSDAPDVEGVPGWWIECKHHKKCRHLAALQQAEQARDAAHSTNVVVAHCKDNHDDPVVILRERDFLALLRALRLAAQPGATETTDTITLAQPIT